MRLLVLLKVRGRGQQQFAAIIRTWVQKSMMMPTDSQIE
jgi:hypothetical protein